MTQEEFYIWLMNCPSMAVELPHFNSEFLNSYEISKLFLEKIGLKYLNESQQKYLNLDAISSWFRVSDYIYLKYDIPEILKLIPKRIIGDLNLKYSQIHSLPQLEIIERSLLLEYSKIESLPELDYVGENIYVHYGDIDYWKNYFKETGRHHLVEKIK